MPVEKIVHELPENEQICDCCGEKLHACGHDVLRRELTVIPQQFKVTEHVQTAYSCRNCEKNEISVPMKKSKIPKPVISGSGVVSPSLLAQIINNKYSLGLPLYRQEQELKRLEIEIPRQNMANWIIFSAEKWFSKIYENIQKEILKNKILHADETSVQVLNEDGKKPESKSYMWLYRTSKCAKNHALVFEYQPNRNGENPEKFLINFKGYLHSDGYEGYHSLKNVINIGCWAHLRRKFNDCVKTLSNDLKNSVPATIGLNFCSKIFHLDKSFEELDFKERFKQRNLYLKPLVKSFFEWAKSEFSKNKLPNSNFGKALTYAINQEKYLMNVFKDGRLELSNNLAENSIRPFVVGRKNWLFCNSVKGAKSSAVVYSIIETAKANGLKPLSYLKFLFETLPNLGSEDSIESCLPWSKSLPEHCFLKVKS